MILASLSGCLLFLSDYPVHAWPVQSVALIPFYVGLIRSVRSTLHAFVSGLALGVFYIVPTLVVLEFPVLMGGGLGLYMAVLWGALAAGSRWAFRVRAIPLGSPIAVGAVAVIVEWIDFSLLPVWGTAQCFARVWSAAPFSIQFVSITGVTGLVFVLTTAQALLASVIATLLARRRTATTGGPSEPRIITRFALLIALLGLPLIANTVLWHQREETTIRVAAIGWNWDHLERGFDTSAYIVYDSMYAPLLKEALESGAQVIVSPEVVFRFTEFTRPELLSQLSYEARTHGVWLLVGAFDHQRYDNRLIFVGPDGRVHGEYRKTHLIPFAEDYEAGDGTLVTAAVGDVRIGGMICQDDNFTDIARRYGQQQVQVMAVPTNDWEQVKDHHLENALFRAVENRYGVIRAASNGISVLVSPHGEVLARRDHFEEGPGVIVADMPVGTGATFYSEVGDWFPATCFIFLVACCLGQVVRRRRESRKSAAFSRSYS